MATPARHRGGGPTVGAVWRCGARRHVGSGVQLRADVVRWGDGLRLPDASGHHRAGLDSDKPAAESFPLQRDWNSERAGGQAWMKFTTLRNVNEYTYRSHTQRYVEGGVICRQLATVSSSCNTLFMLLGSGVLL
jgi:hypothetical protein